MQRTHFACNCNGLIFVFVSSDLFFKKLNFSVGLKCWCERGLGAPTTKKHALFAWRN